MLNSEEPTPLVESRRLPSPDRRSSVTPLDVRQAKFSSAMRGYERAEVNAFLLEASDGYEQATRENERLRQEVARVEASLSQYRELESALKGALMSAQKISDDMKVNANAEAARLVREAEGRAELILHKAQARLEDTQRQVDGLVRDAEAKAEMIIQKAQTQLEDTQRELDGLRLKRREAEVALESIIAALHSTLEYVREQEQRETRVIQHRPLLGPIAQSA
jgi:cell division initiation protein